MIIAASDEPLRNEQFYLKTISAFCARSNSGRKRVRRLTDGAGGSTYEHAPASAEAQWG